MCGHRLASVLIAGLVWLTISASCWYKTAKNSVKPDLKWLINQ